MLCKCGLFWPGNTNVMVLAARVWTGAAAAPEPSGVESEGWSPDRSPSSSSNKFDLWGMSEFERQHDKPDSTDHMEENLERWLSRFDKSRGSVVDVGGGAKNGRPIFLENGRAVGGMVDGEQGTIGGTTAEDCAGVDGVDHDANGVDHDALKTGALALAEQTATTGGTGTGEQEQGRRGSRSEDDGSCAAAPTEQQEDLFPKTIDQSNSRAEQDRLKDAKASENHKTTDHESLYTRFADVGFGRADRTAGTLAQLQCDGLTFDQFVVVIHWALSSIKKKRKKARKQQ